MLLLIQGVRIPWFHNAKLSYLTSPSRPPSCPTRNYFLKANLVNIAYSSTDTQPIILINSEKIPLLTDQLSPQSHFVSSFLSIPTTLEGAPPNPVMSNFSERNPIPSSDCPTPGQLFHLDPDTNIEHMTSFLQECKVAKYKHSNMQEDINIYSMQPMSMDDMIQANFEEKKYYSRSWS